MKVCRKDEETSQEMSGERQCKPEKANNANKCHAAATPQIEPNWSHVIASCAEKYWRPSIMAPPPLLTAYSASTKYEPRVEKEIDTDSIDCVSLVHLVHGAKKW